MRRTLTAAVVALGVITTPGCDKFVTVPNPSTLEAESIDPERDASLLSQSVFTRFVTTLEDPYVLGAWFTNHARVGDTFPTRNAVGQRNIPNTGNETDAVWNNIHTNLQFARSTITSIETAGPSLDLARAWWVSGFSILQQAEYFCEGTIAASTTEPRARMSVAALLDSAIIDLTKAQDILGQLPAPQSAEATDLTRSAQVGIARAHLQAGRKAQAATAATAVPAGFTYNILHIDNPSQRGLGNQMWAFSETRISLVVGPEYRTIATGTTQPGSLIAGSGIPDPRVTFTDMNRLAQDGVLQFYRQGRHPGWAAPMRFASKLEAQYIEQEANENTVAMLGFINARRAAGNQVAYAGALDLTSLRGELMLQKSIDFWLEGHEMRDYRRDPAIYPFVLPTGNNYYKNTLGPVGTDACWPVPFTELTRNKNWYK